MLSLCVGALNVYTTEAFPTEARSTGLAEHARPLHSVRHTGPSRDLACGYRTWEQIKRRGRWQTDEAVMRYTKHHVYSMVMSKLPEEVHLRAEAILRGRKPRPTPPIA